MRWDEIERRADQLLVGIPEQPPEVPVEAIARRLGLPVLKIKLDDGVSGVLVTEGDRSYIAVQQSDHLHRRRFSTGHEIAHHCLGHLRNEAVHVDQVPTIRYRAIYRSADSAGSKKEAEANHFAACLLMPRKRVVAEVGKLAGGKPLTDPDVEELARRFKVSLLAMTYRLQFLELLG